MSDNQFPQFVQVGHPYPSPMALPQHEYSSLEFTASLFTLLYYIDQPEPQDLATFEAGILDYGVVEPLPGLPFVVLAFGDGSWTIDASLNLQTLEASAAADWLEGEGNMLNLVLIDASNNQVLTLRQITADPAFTSRVRESLRRQAEHVGSAELVQEAAELIQRDNTTDDLLLHAELYRAGGPARL